VSNTAAHCAHCMHEESRASRLQGLDSVVVQPHMADAVRVSVAVVEGPEGPVALLPSQEESVSPEADFLEADLEAERKQAEIEVSSWASAQRCAWPGARLRICQSIDIESTLYFFAKMCAYQLHRNVCAWARGT
jgi:hypothetical protein